LPQGIQVNNISCLTGKEKSLDSFINCYVYDIKKDTGLYVTDFYEKTEILAQRNNRQFNMKDMVEDIRQLDQNTFQVTLRDLGEIKVKLAEILNEIFGVNIDELDVTRIYMYGWDSVLRNEPMEKEGKIWAAKF
jgi:hypothetical protein